MPRNEDEKSAALVLLATGAGLVALAWAHRFVQDDAFISFRYAQHLARGQGLTWNVGEPPIQGFSNLLWTVLLALTMRAGAEPVATTYAIGLVSFAGTLAATYAITRALGGTPCAASAALVWFGTNYTASSYATGGLETSTHTCLLAWATYVAVRERLLWLSVLSGALLWLRLDSVLVVGILLSWCAWRARHDGARLLSLLGPVALAGAALVAFDLWTFRALLPNTFYAKVPGVDPRILETGGEYVLAFLRNYELVPFALLAAVALPWSVRQRQARFLLVACVVAWTAYVIWVGGDFMEFRFIVPILPMAFAVLRNPASAVTRRTHMFSFITKAMWAQRGVSERPPGLHRTSRYASTNEAAPQTQRACGVCSDGWRSLDESVRAAPPRRCWRGVGPFYGQGTCTVAGSKKP